MWDDYQLLDFGNGRKLERFGAYVVDRPCPAADGLECSLPHWESDFAFERKRRGEGRWRGQPPQQWEIGVGGWRMSLKPTPFGHLGIFPEQHANWQWIDKQVRRVVAANARHAVGPAPIEFENVDAPQSETAPIVKVLNLFAYTGASTLAAAAAGAEVTHVDSSKTVVLWARENARKSGLAEAPIRWIHEDARKFVRRELKRGHRYDAVILDPPTYGRGASGQAWRIAFDLPALLADCARLTKGRRKFLLLSCHSPGHGPAVLEAMLADCVFGSCQCNARAESISLKAVDGRNLSAGALVRWPG
ncbi:MAG: class I SAM-dependent methyltransferase [Planctomycetales bacterium]|nr:class I SAM-dependent methyltransferase [Planctomycetales bacterium]